MTRPLANVFSPRCVSLTPTAPCCRPNEWVAKENHDDPHVFETLDPADPFSNYSEAQCK